MVCPIQILLFGPPLASDIILLAPAWLLATQCPQCPQCHIWSRWRSSSMKRRRKGAVFHQQNAMRRWLQCSIWGVHLHYEWSWCIRQGEDGLRDTQLLKHVITPKHQEFHRVSLHRLCQCVSPKANLCQSGTGKPLGKPPRPRRPDSSREAPQPPLRPAVCPIVTFCLLIFILDCKIKPGD